MNLVRPMLREPPAKDREQPKPLGFAQWLESSCQGKTGDEYYWQHQQELQNSALQFKPSNEVNNPYSQTFTEEEPAACHKIGKLALSQEFSASIAKQEISVPDYQANNWVLELTELINRTYDKPGQVTPSRNNEFSQTKLRASVVSEPLANKVFTRSVVFKNHQLFIEANEAEFSLNGAELTKEQIKELSLLIKQWLNNKGIKLEHFLINGVKQ